MVSSSMQPIERIKTKQASNAFNFFMLSRIKVEKDTKRIQDRLFYSYRLACYARYFVQSKDVRSDLQSGKSLL